MNLRIYNVGALYTPTHKGPISHFGTGSHSSVPFSCTNKITPIFTITNNLKIHSTSRLNTLNVTLLALKLLLEFRWKWHKVRSDWNVYLLPVSLGLLFECFKSLKETKFFGTNVKFEQKIFNCRSFMGSRAFAIRDTRGFVSFQILSISHVCKKDWAFPQY